MKPHILVVDDEESIRGVLKSRLERDNYEVTTAVNFDDAISKLKSGREPSVLVTDLKMPGRDGFDLMANAKKLYPATKVVVITGHGEKTVAVKALRSGATDYLEKPFDLEDLSHCVGRAVRENQLEIENRDLVGRLEARVERSEGKVEDRTWYVPRAKSMEPVNNWLTVLRREAMRGGTDEPSVLILGESGTGKEGIARMVHASSRRGKGAWVAVNCANFGEQLLESELFGHERGAFTGANTLKRGLFEIAKGGTLFLDEIGEMDLKLQAKLLRVLQERVFRRVGGTQDQTADVRIVAATNQLLDQKVKSGQFREDLYHRLNRVVIEVPALRNRTEDIVPMAEQFAEQSFRSRGKKFGGFTPDAKQALEGYRWPGNVRELLNFIERSALVWEGEGSVTAGVLGLPSSGPVSVGPDGRPQLQSVASPFQTPDNSGAEGYMQLKKKWSESFEREYIRSALSRHHGNVSAAAREAKIDRSNFLRLLRRHRIGAQEFRKVA